MRILQHLHRHKGELLTATEIAQSTSITYPFFIKIAGQLRKKGLLKSVQGRNGGYLLGKPADKISLYDVFLCIEGDLHFCPCPKDGEPCPQDEISACKLHAFLYDLRGKIIEEMSDQSIADLAA